MTETISELTLAVENLLEVACDYAAALREFDQNGSTETLEEIKEIEDELMSVCIQYAEELTNEEDDEGG